MVAVARGKTKCFHSTHVWVAGPVGVLAGLGVGGLLAGGLACGRARRGVVALWRRCVALWLGGLGSRCVALASLWCCCWLCCVRFPVCRGLLCWWSLLLCLPCLSLLGLLRLAFVLGVFLVGFRFLGPVSDFGFLEFCGVQKLLRTFMSPRFQIVLCL